MIYETNSLSDTLKLGREFARQVQPGDVCALIGGLGAGKTAFVQGVAEGLGITEPVSSPTFTIMQVYEGGRMPLYHFDVYRIAAIEEMDEIGYEDCFYGSGITIVEWADLITEIMPGAYRIITIEQDLEKGFDYRCITINWNGERHENIGD